VVDGGEPGVDSRDEGKHAGRNDLLFVEKMMWMGVEKMMWMGRCEDVVCMYDHASSAVLHCCVYRDTNPGQEGGEQWRRNSLGKVDNV